MDLHARFGSPGDRLHEWYRRVAERRTAYRTELVWHAAAPTWDPTRLVFLDETGITLRRRGVGTAPGVFGVEASSCPPCIPGSHRRSW